MPEKVRRDVSHERLIKDLTIILRESMYIIHETYIHKITRLWTALDKILRPKLLCSSLPELLNTYENQTNAIIHGCK